MQWVGDKLCDQILKGALPAWKEEEETPGRASPPWHAPRPKATWTSSSSCCPATTPGSRWRHARPTRWRLLHQRPSSTAATANTGWLLQTDDASPSSVRERFNLALSYIRETQSDGDVLVQLWVPVNGNDGQLVLTTSGQPFTLNHRSDSLIRFREVSTKYHFSADVMSGTPGLPGRVFIGRLPEWSPDVRYFTSYEYPRVSHAQILDVHGTMGLPVFEKGSYSCLGVIELIMTKQKLNFTPELNAVCSALQV
jgi:hypothetical protein